MNAGAPESTASVIAAARSSVPTTLKVQTRGRAMRASFATGTIAAAASVAVSRSPNAAG
jgi:hypothetical protein